MTFWNFADARSQCFALTMGPTAPLCLRLGFQWGRGLTVLKLGKSQANEDGLITLPMTNPRTSIMFQASKVDEKNLEGLWR